MFTADQQKKAATIVKYLQNKGYTLEGACGAAGNMFAESRFNAGAWNPNDNGSPSGGLCQWHLERLSSLQNFAAKVPVNWKTMDVQLSYLNSELNGNYKSVGSVLKTTNSVERASETWGDKFEVFAGHSNFQGAEHMKRKKYALAIYNGIKGAGWEAGDVSDYAGENGENSPSVVEDSSTIFDEMVEVDMKGDLDDPFMDLSEYAKFADYEKLSESDNQYLKIHENTVNENATNDAPQKSLEETHSEIKSDGTEVKPPILNQIFAPSISVSEHSWASDNVDKSDKKPNDVTTQSKTDTELIAEGLNDTYAI